MESQTLVDGLCGLADVFFAVTRARASHGAGAAGRARVAAVGVRKRVAMAVVLVHCEKAREDLPPIRAYVVVVPPAYEVVGWDHPASAYEHRHDDALCEGELQRAAMGVVLVLFVLLTAGARRSSMMDSAGQ